MISSLRYAGGVEYFVPGIGVFSTILSPLGLILIVGTAVFQLIALRRERAHRISLTSPPPQSGELQVGRGPSPSRNEQRIEIGSPLRRSAWAGIGLLLLGTAWFASIQHWIIISQQYFQWAQMLPLKPAFTTLPSFGLVCALVLSWLVMFHMVFYQFDRRFGSKGLAVFVMKSVPHPDHIDRWAVPLVLKVQFAGPNVPPKLFLNSKPLSWDNLSSSLRAELSKQPVHLVYVEAGADVPWQMYSERRRSCCNARSCY